MNGEDYYDYVMDILYQEGQELGLEEFKLLDYVNDSI